MDGKCAHLRVRYALVIENLHVSPSSLWRPRMADAVFGLICILCFASPAQKRRSDARGRNPDDDTHISFKSHEKEWNTFNPDTICNISLASITLCDEYGI